MKRIKNKTLHGLHCFRCKTNIKKGTSELVWRDLNNFPLCKECFDESLDDYDETTREWIMESIDNEKYQRNFSKFYDVLLFIQCPNQKCLSDTMIDPTDIRYNANGKSVNEIGTTFSCFDCGFFIEIDSNDKITRYAKDEDEFLEKYPNIENK